MNFLKNVERLQLLNKLIKEERTGNPDELAARLGISRSKLYEHLDHLKCLGLRIEYSRAQNSFLFGQGSQLDIQFSLKIIQEGEIKKVYGGSAIFPSVLFSGRSNSILDSGLNRLV